MKKAPSRERRKSSATPAGAKKEPSAKAPAPERNSPAVPAPLPTLSVPTGESGVLVEVEERVRKALALLEDRLAAAPPPRAADGLESPLSGGELDEVAASFRRAVSEVIDRRLEELLPAVAALYHRLYEESRSLSIDAEPVDREDLQLVLAEAVQDTGKILKALGGSAISPQVGEPYDPLIHLAVGEASSPGTRDGVVAGVVRPGTRSGRGRVLIPARVLLGRQG